LRARLAAARNLGHAVPTAGQTAAAVQRGGGSTAVAVSADRQEVAAQVVLAPGSARALGRALAPGERGLVLGRRAAEVSGTSIARRAMLPAVTAPELVEAASVAGEPVIWVPRLSERPERVAYVPDLISRPVQSMRASQSADAAGYSRDYFETLFAEQPDPWQYTSPYEQTKYQQTLELLPSAPIGRALELACA